MIFLWLLTMTSTTVGSAKVEVSPISSVFPAATFRRILLIIFPDLVLGKPGVNCIISGTANPESEMEAELFKKLLNGFRS